MTKRGKKTCASGVEGIPHLGLYLPASRLCSCRGNKYKEPLESYSDSFLNLKLKTSPYGLVGQPTGITVVISISEGGLQLARRCDDCWVLYTHSLGIGEGEGIAVMGGPVVKHHTWNKEMLCLHARLFTERHQHFSQHDARVTSRVSPTVIWTRVQCWSISHILLIYFGCVVYFIWTKYRHLTGLLITAFHDLQPMDNGHILRTLTR